MSPTLSPSSPQLSNQRNGCSASKKRHGHAPGFKYWQQLNGFLVGTRRTRAPVVGIDLSATAKVAVENHYDRPSGRPLPRTGPYHRLRPARASPEVFKLRSGFPYKIRLREITARVIQLSLVKLSPLVTEAVRVVCYGRQTGTPRISGKPPAGGTTEAVIRTG